MVYYLFDFPPSQMSESDKAASEEAEGEKGLGGEKFTVTLVRTLTPTWEFRLPFVLDYW